MELKAYVLGVMSGLSEALSELSKINSDSIVVVPAVGPDKIAVDAHLSPYQRVQFDLAIEVSQSLSASVKGGFVQVITGSVEGESRKANTNRVSFSVPILIVPRDTPEHLRQRISDFLPTTQPTG